ncbi:hypothetical protein KFE25_011630 [Diacronema lutheri]|uniref:ABC1 atypical kinase-like domain-containing protein n=2 Tax=Diacronema lutheri TaxID=2081491 RepID=A0A8J5XFW4_DIALT|nr:hypothetical protein KFE25_011630 [Diacronema lutheri]
MQGTLAAAGRRRRLWPRVGAAAAGGVAAAAAAAYYFDPSVRRAVTFWARVGPIAGHYLYAQRRYASDPARQRAEYERLHGVYAPASLAVVLELRGLLVKFGQQLSSRPELVPHEYVRAFRSLQSEVPAEPAAAIVALVESELRRPIGELFARFDEQPCGAASIAQAHRARTPDGREVVVKVQLPHAAAHFAADLRGLRALVWLSQPEAMPLFDEFARQYVTELDFARERASLAAMHAALTPRFSSTVAVPAVDDERCSARILTMSFLPGEPLERSVRAALEAAGVDASRAGLRKFLEATDPAADAPVGASGRAPLARESRARAALERLVGMDALLWAYDLALRARALALGVLAACARAAAQLEVIPAARARDAALASARAASAVSVSRASALMRSLFDVYAFEIFEWGFFNSDPHPGNVLVLPDGRLGLIDYGQCKTLPLDVRLALAEVIVAVADGAADARVAAAFRRTGFRSEKDSDAFIAAIARIMLSRVDPALMRGKTRKALFASDRVAHFPPDLTSVWRAVALLRGSALSLRCNISPAERWRAHASALLASHARPGRVHGVELPSAVVGGDMAGDGSADEHPRPGAGAAGVLDGSRRLDR